MDEDIIPARSGFKIFVELLYVPLAFEDRFSFFAPGGYMIKGTGKGEINTVYYDPGVITVGEMEQALKDAGTYIGSKTE